MAIYQNGVESYKGCVLAEYENNGYHDSDFYAIVWDYAENRLKSVMFGTTRAGGEWGCSVDATPEVVNLAKQAKKEQQDLDNAEYNYYFGGVAAKGKTATIANLTGKKADLNNSQGVICWVGPDRYGSKWDIRVGIEINGEKHFVNGKNVFVNNYEKDCYQMNIEFDSFRKVRGFNLVYRLQF
jgi:hypothetical protein